MKPLNIVLIAFGVILLISWFLIQALATVISLTKLIWPLIAVIIVIGIALAIWKWFAEQVKAFWEIDLLRKIFQTILLVGLVYLPFFYFSYGWLTSKLIGSTGFSYHHTLIIVTILQLPMVGVIYYLVSLIWPERGRAMKGFLIISLIGPLVIAYVMYQNPYWFFDHQTGENKIWVSDTEKRIYYSPGYGIEDGKPLRPGTAEDTRKFKDKKESFRDFIEEKFKKRSKKEARVEQTRRFSGILKLPKDERVVDKDIQGRILYHRKGERLHFVQLTNPPGSFWVVNHCIPSFQIKRRNYITGRAVADGKVELKATGGKAITVQVRIIPSS